MNKRVKQNLKIILATTFTLILSGCGSSGSGSIDGKAVAGVSLQAIPLCNELGIPTADANASQAEILSKGTVIHKTTDDSIVRVWHFQNGKKVACMLQGEAVIAKK